MYKFIFSLFLSVIFTITAYSQSTGFGNNQVMISTTRDGNVTWSANIDGNNRKGYIDQNLQEDACNPKGTDAEVLVPVTSSLYPHPSTDMLFFSGTGYDSFQVTISDLDGKVIATQQYTESSSMDISSFNNGTYRIDIVSEKTGEKYTRKIVKE
jgi:hypothetical protein